MKVGFNPRTFSILMQYSKLKNISLAAIIEQLADDLAEDVHEIYGLEEDNIKNN